MKNTCLRFLLFCYLLFAFCIVHAQEKKDQKSFELGIELGAEIIQKVIVSDSGSSSIGHESNLGYGFNSTLLVRKKISNKITLRSGLGYKLKVYRDEINNILFPINIINNWGPTTINENTLLHFVSIPVGFQYQINNKLQFDVGLDIDFIVFENFIRKISEPNPDTILLTTDTDTENILPAVFLGLQYELNENLYLNPYFNMSFTKFKVPVSFAESNTQLNFGVKLGSMF